MTSAEFNAKKLAESKLAESITPKTQKSDKSTSPDSPPKPDTTHRNDTTHATHTTKHPNHK